MLLKPACMVLALMLALPAAAHAQGMQSSLSQTFEATRCKRPDRTLIRKDTAQGVSWTSEASTPSRYNDQARDFNDCTRLYIINANREINRIRDEAQGRLDGIVAGANQQVRGIEAEINAVIATAEGAAPPAGPQPPPFPEPECRLPDESLQQPAPGQRSNTLDRTSVYDAQHQAYNACVQAWIGQAKNVIRQIAADAHVALDAEADDANRQISEIKRTILAALSQTRMAVREQAIALDQLKASLAPVAAPQPVPGAENVVVTGEGLPRSADTPTGAGDPDGISCRAPQIRPDSRLLGPEICKRNREWAVIFKRGGDLAPDGVTIVSSEKQRTFNPNTCITSNSVSGLPVFTTRCTNGP
ncbi:MAG TPA: hypothetical protein VHX18_06915 [Rhizomicrobium sp.]|nr:hypothetical protein [Rhizomicrobium sp.]